MLLYFVQRCIFWPPTKYVSVCPPSCSKLNLPKFYLKLFVFLCVCKEILPSDKKSAHFKSGKHILGEFRGQQFEGFVNEIKEICQNRRRKKKLLVCVNLKINSLRGEMLCPDKVCGKACKQFEMVFKRFEMAFEISPKKFS